MRFGFGLLLIFIAESWIKTYNRSVKHVHARVEQLAVEQLVNDVDESDDENNDNTLNVNVDWDSALGQRRRMWPFCQHLLLPSV